MRALTFWILILTLFTGFANAQRPNILLILSDDHSLPHVGAYGGNCRQLGLTPNLDAFAAQGMLFHRAYTAAPQCAPSRAALATWRARWAFEARALRAFPPRAPSR